MCFSCVGPQSFKNGNLLKPGGRFTTYMPKGGSDAYIQGWTDGCNSALSIFGHYFHKHFYAFKKDQRFYDKVYGDTRDLLNGKKITEKNKKEYQAAWAATYSWCRHSMVGIQQGGKGMTPHLPGDDDIMKMHGTHNIYELQSWGPAASPQQGWYANW